MKPRLLLVEDDPASRTFIAAVLAAFPAEVDTAASVAAALDLATTRDYALWLFDARLPDGSGIELLLRLRQQGRQVPALAHTASQDAQDLADLVRAGFLSTLIKPFTASELHEALTGLLGTGADPSLPEQPTPAPASTLVLWDDAHALAAMNGNRGHVESLRGLFLAELPMQRTAILAALERGEPQAAHDLLHRLKASCGFVGAARLRSAVERLDEALDERRCVAEFSDAVDQTLSSKPEHSTQAL